MPIIIQSATMAGTRQEGLTTDPETLTFQDAVDLLPVDTLYNEAKKFYDGDHWQGGDAWVGPRLDENEQESSDVMAEIEETLVSHPALEEVTDRHVDAVTIEPTWTLALRRQMDMGEQPNETEQGLLDEAEAALTNWWDEKDALGAVRDAVVDLVLGGRGMMRLMVPEGELRVRGDGQPFVPSGDLEESLDRLWPVHVDPTMGEVFRDPVTMKQIGVFVYEVTDILTGVPTQFAEITYLDDKKQTVLRVVKMTPGKSGSDQAEEGRATIDMGKKLWIFKMAAKRLITEPIVSSQKLLNMDLTMMGKNVVLGGFLERIILNGQPPGNWEEDGDGKKTFVPARFKTGAASVNWIAGAEIGVDPDTKEPRIATPSVIFKDPVGPETFTKTQEAVYKNILQGARQLHVIISGDAIASGESRKQARDDYEKSLSRTKTRLDAMGKWMLEGVLKVAASFSGNSKRFDGIRIDFDTQIDAGPISSEDRNSMQQEVAAGYRSVENYMRAARVTKDPVAEIRKISEEQQASNPLAQVQLQRAQLGLAVDRRSQGLGVDPKGPLGGAPTPPDSATPPSPAVN